MPRVPKPSGSSIAETAYAKHKKIRPNAKSHPNPPRLSFSNLQPPLPQFLSTLQTDYPNFHLKLGRRFSFKPPKTIQIDQNSQEPPVYFALLTLHELGHALSNHKDYNIHVERLKIESEAWQRAKTVLKNHPEYANIIENLAYDEDFAETQLDSYRDWLHTKSTCPTCGLTRYETKSGWRCPLCNNN